MPAKSNPSRKRVPVAGRKIAAKARRTTGKIKQARFDATGLTGRVHGHVSARTKRAQARRDAR